MAVFKIVIGTSNGDTKRLDCIATSALPLVSFPVDEAMFTHECKDEIEINIIQKISMSVSYTHMTLPTKTLVAMSVVLIS